MIPSSRRLACALLALATAVFAANSATVGTGIAQTRLAGPAAEAAPDLRYLSQVGGSLTTMAAINDGDDQRLFIALGARIEVYDVRDADAPQWLGESVALPAAATHMAIDGGKLYATLLGGGLYIFTIEALPEITGILPGLGDGAIDLRVKDGFAYVLARDVGLRTADVRDPAAPRLLAEHRFPSTGDPSRQLALESFDLRGSDLAIAATDPAIHEGPGRWLILLDVSDPERAAEHGRLAFEAPQPRNLVWRDDHIYIDAGALWVVDAFDKRAPRMLGQLPSPEEGLQLGGVYAAGERLIQSGARRDGNVSVLVAYDLEDPATPLPIKIHDNGPFGKVLIAGDRLYSMSDVTASIGLYEFDRFKGPQTRGRLHPPGLIGDIAVGAGRLTMVGRAALWTVALDDPRRVLGRAVMPWSTSRIALRGNLLYMAAGRDGLRTVNMTDPAAPRELEPLPVDAVGSTVYNIMLHGDQAYVLVRRSRAPTDIWILDLTPAAGPVRLATLTLDLGWNDMPQMAVAGSTLLLSSDHGPSSRKLVAVDVHDKLAPREIWRITLPEHVWSLAAGSGSTVYAGTDNAILTLDIEQPDLKIERDRMDIGPADAPRAVRGLTWTGDRLYALLASPRGPDEPQEVGRFANGGTGTLRSIDLRPDGSLRARGALDIAANFNTGAAHRLLVHAADIAVSGGPTGVTLIRRASGRGVFADVFVPWVVAPR
ncbi:MAG: hypothetical protein IPL60_03740 [Ardenticatenia bacterium]|nr:hypothetical protein [Ardenticatenia bacterium]